MPLPKLIESLNTIQLILAHHDSIIQTHTSSADYSPVKLVETLLELKNTDPLNNLERAMQLFKELESDVHVAHLVQENIKQSADFKQGYASRVIKAWNQYMYHFLLHDFQQKVAFLNNYSSQPDREAGIVCLVDSLKYAKNAFDLLLNKDNAEASSEEKKLSTALRTQLDKIDEGDILISSHLEYVLSEIDSLIDDDYNAVEDLDGPIGAEPQAEQIILIKRIIQRTEYAVELMAFISQAEHGFTLSEKFKDLRLEILSTHTDALRNLGFQLYEKDQPQAIDYLSRASTGYRTLLTLKPRNSLFKEAQESCQCFIPDKKPARKKQSIKRLSVDISSDLVIPSAHPLNPSTPSKASGSANQPDMLVSPRTPLELQQQFYRENGPPKKRFCAAFFGAGTVSTSSPHGFVKK